MKIHTQTIMSLVAVLSLAIMLQEVVADAADYLILIQEDACANPVFLSKQLVLHFPEPDAVAWLMGKNGSRLADMMTILKDTYNELSFYSCDFPLFRHVHNISVLDYDSYNNSTSADHNKYYGAPTLTFELEISCRNCTDGQPLFKVPAIPVNVSIMNATTTNTMAYATGNTTANATSFFQTDVELATGNNRTGMEGNHSDYYCICPADHNVFSPSLTAADFVLLANNNLLAQQMNVTISHVMELEELTCSSIVKQFTSLVYVHYDFSGKGFPSREEVRALEESFMQTYNLFSFESCDPYYRKINQVKLGFKLESEDLFREDEVHLAAQTPKTGSNNMSLWWNTTTSWNMTSNETTWMNTTTGWNATLNKSTSMEGPSRNTRKAVFTVDAECRNCRVNSAGWHTLFDNGAGLHRFTGEENGTLLIDQGTATLRYLRGSNWHKSLPVVMPDPSNATTCICPLKQESNAILTNHTMDSQPVNASSTTLTEESILPLYNSKIDKQQEQGTLEMVESAGNFEEGQIVNCDPNITSFFSQVFTEIRVDPTNITSQQIRKLEQAFMDAYNELAFKTCDGLFRGITEVELIIFHTTSNSSQGGHQPKESNVTTNIFHFDNTTSAPHNSSSSFQNNSSGSFGTNSSSSGTDSSSPDSVFDDNDFGGVNSTDELSLNLVATLFSIKGECRGCEVSSSGTFNLFDDAFDRRRQLKSDVLGNQSLLSSDNYRNGFIADAGICTCLAGVDPSAIGHGPTSEAFGEALAGEVEILDQNGEIESVETTVGDILEGMQVPCSGEVQDFASYVYAELGIDVQVSDDFQERFEHVFLETYNTLSFQACDEFFRVVTEVRLLISDEFYLTSDNINTTQTVDVSAAHFEVIGHCRNCDVSNGHFSLFDDAFGAPRFRKRDRRDGWVSRRISNDVVVPQGDRASEAMDFCLCPHGKSPGEDPPPSEESFLDEFNENLIEHEKSEESQKEEIMEAVGHNDSFGVPPIIRIEEVVPPNRGVSPVSFFMPSPAASPSNLTSTENYASPQSTPEPTWQPANLSEATRQPTHTPSPALPVTEPHVVSPPPIPQPSSLQPTPNSTVLQPILSQTPESTLQPTPSSASNSPSQQAAQLTSTTPNLQPTAGPAPVPTPQTLLYPTFHQPTLFSTPVSTQQPAASQGNPTPDPAEPTSNLTRTPKLDPTTQPTREQRIEPTVQSPKPTSAPSMEPSLKTSQPPISRSVAPLSITPPSSSPTLDPVLKPTQQPTLASYEPTRAPLLTLSVTLPPIPRPSLRPTSQPSPSPTPQPSPSPTPQPSPSPTPQPSPSPTPQPSPSPTRQPTPSPTPEPTPQPTPPPTPGPSVQPTPSPTLNPTPQPTPSPTPELTPQPVPQPSPDPTRSPTPDPTTQVPTPDPTTRVPTPDPTSTPTHEPTPKPTPQPELQPSPTPTPDPTFHPTPDPSAATGYPTLDQTSPPTVNPTPDPTPEPTTTPTRHATAEPTITPTGFPSLMPTYAIQPANPTQHPTPETTRDLTSTPTREVTAGPAAHPAPSQIPAPQPSSHPTREVTNDPTPKPTNRPTPLPTPSPTREPSLEPYPQPTQGCQAPLLPSDLTFGQYSGNPHCHSGGSDMPFGFDYGWKMNNCQNGTFILDAVPESEGGEIRGSCSRASNIRVTVNCNNDKSASISWTGESDSLVVIKVKGGPGGVLYNTIGISGGTFFAAPNSNGRDIADISHIEVCVQCDDCSKPESPIPSSLSSQHPSAGPSFFHSGSPSNEPTVVPGRPSGDPTTEGSTSAPPANGRPTVAPASLTTFTPTTEGPALPPGSPQLPSTIPSDIPSDLPSILPSGSPSSSPSRYPSRSPSAVPSKVTSAMPSRLPSPLPSENPLPSLSPSGIPSRSAIPIPFNSSSWWSH